MTLNELSQLLETLNIPVFYSHTNSKVKAPYLVYYEIGSQNFKADNKVYVKFKRIQIELYTSKKNTALENQLETLLDDHSLSYDPDYFYLEGEKVFQVMYEIKI